jgi:uncharacterized protein YdbL (DUF1318 family)
MKKLIATILLVMAFQSAWAIDIDTAKDQGLVGEANTGYLAAVQTPASSEVQALIKDVNAKRKAHFERTAEKTDANLLQVQARFYELAVKKTAPGRYYQDANGTWRKK